MKMKSTTISRTLSRHSVAISQKSLFSKLTIAIVSLILVLSSTLFIVFSNAGATDYDAKIRALEAQISRYDEEAARLGQEADSLQREVSRLNNEKAAIQAKVDVSQAKFNQLTKEISDNEAKIESNRDVLGGIVADLYVDDSVSTIEMLASSNGVGDYLDKQEYRSVARDGITSTIAEIKALKIKLEKQKKEVEAVLEDEKTQRDQLAAKEQEQANLLSQTRGDEAEYRNLSQSSAQQKDKLQREQQAAIEAALRRANAGGGSGTVSAGDPNKGGYPAYLANSNYYAPLVDPWGMYSRQCVSYTAWKVHQKNGYMPYWGGRGNANQWPANARAAGITVSKSPKAGSVGVMMAGQYGHVVWVESVNGNGTINISQYNYWNAGGSGWGHYSEMYNVSPAAYDWYIHF